MAETPAHSRASKATKEADDAPQAEAASTGNGNGTDAPTGGVQPPTDLPVAQLVENSDALIGHPVHAAAVALSSFAPDEMMSVDQARDLVDNWMTTPVQVDPAQTQEA